MARLFVFGIGGTGSRVLKSLTMLLSSGVNVNGFEIVPIFIDPHKDLPEFKDCKELISLYSEIHKATYKNQTPQDRGFFKTPMLALSDISNSGMSSGYDFDERIDDSFGEFIELDLLEKGDINRNLIELLYSDRNLNTPLSVGFKGNPNIGSVVLNTFDVSDWYKSFEGIFSEGDRIFIISSIFGGTGAAGFPLLVKNLRRSENKYVKNALIGALPVMPYFKLGDPEAEAEHNDIDSNSFFTKTKSALSYYHKHLKGVNALYYLADLHEQSTPYKNDEKLQQNKAHIIELIGASAIVEFCLSNDNADLSEQHFHYTPADDASPINFYNIGNQLRDKIYLQMVNFHIFSKVHHDFKSQKDAPFIKNEQFDDSFFKSDAVISLEKFMDKFYSKWIQELDNNERKFSPFNFALADGKFHKLVVGNTLSDKKLVFFQDRFDTSNFINSMGTQRHVISGIADKSKISKYIILAQAAIEKVNQEKFKI